MPPTDPDHVFCVENRRDRDVFVRKGDIVAWSVTSNRGISAISWNVRLPKRHINRSLPNNGKRSTRYILVVLHTKRDERSKSIPSDTPTPIDPWCDMVGIRGRWRGKLQATDGYIFPCAGMRHTRIPPASWERVVHHNFADDFSFMNQIPHRCWISGPWCFSQPKSPHSLP